MKLLLFLAGLFIIIQQLEAQVGMLDPTFGNNGIVDLGTLDATAFQSTGKLVAVKRTPTGFILFRYNLDGSTDNGFGTNGNTTVTIPDVLGVSSVKVSVQNNDNIVVQLLGYAQSIIVTNKDVDVRVIHASFNSNGHLQTSFGDQGVLAEQHLLPNRRGDVYPNRSLLAIQPDGKILSVILWPESNIRENFGRLTRYDLSGNVDLSNIGVNNVLDVIAKPNGKILLLVNSPNFPVSLGQFKATQLNDDGSIDLSFGDNGVATYIPPQNPFYGPLGFIATAAKIDANNNLLVAGFEEFGEGFSRSSRRIITRFSNDGSLDQTFGNGGIASAPPFPVNKIAVQSDGKILLAGSNVARLLSNGLIDNSFGINGLASVEGSGLGSLLVMTIAENRLFVTAGEINVSGFRTSTITKQLAAFKLSSACNPPTFLNTLPIVGNATCGNNDGQISIIPQSGTAPYVYSLDGGATYVNGPNAGFTQFNLAAGSYQLRLKDANGCESEVVTRTITTTGCPQCTPPTFLNTLAIVGDASCNANDGQISLIPTSGSGPFMYSINGGATYVSGPNVGYTFFNLAPGTYQLKLIDAGGCESATITRSVVARYGIPAFLNTLPIIGNATCNQSDGQIVLIPTSGTGPFMYSINGGATYTAGPDAGMTFFNLPEGTYQLRIKTASGCESEVVTRTIESINCPSATPNIAGASKGFAVEENGLDTKLKVSAYPNPSRGRFKLQVLQSVVGKAEVFIYDGKGTLVQQSFIIISKGNTVPVNLSGKAPGMYYLKMVTQQGISTSKILLQ